jgi:hypothetical protein
LLSSPGSDIEAAQEAAGDVSERASEASLRQE